MRGLAACFVLGACVSAACGGSSDIDFGNSGTASGTGASGTGGTGASGGAGASGGSGECRPGETQPCYSGPDGTQGVGVCVAGVQTCTDAGTFGACAGEVTPSDETCATRGDDDCDGETNEGGDDCACTPGVAQDCYSGPPATQDVGPCMGGQQTCNPDGTGYGPCVGEVVPEDETCATPIDDDCDGFVNEGGDGCTCVPDSTQACYSGPAGTQGVGPCVAGQQTCSSDGTSWGPCMGEVLPLPETCSTLADDDCDGQTNEEGPSCVCVPNTTQSCYSGPQGTLNVGPCKAGQQTCSADGTMWGPCAGEVLPAAESCNNGIDDDCSGSVDIGVDADGDGWTTCDNDCCDSPAGCPDPDLVNPGAFEFPNNALDDDCDAATPDVPAQPCSSLEKFTAVTGADLAMAMDICQTTTANAPLPQKKWGLISAEQVLANGNVASAAQLANMQSFQSAVLTAFGTGGVLPTTGLTMAGLSNGRMRDPGDVGYQASTSFGVSSTPPAAFLAAHGGALFGNQGCQGNCPAGTTSANDPVNLRLTIRVPTNTTSLHYHFRFFTNEYQFVCGAFNDFSLGLLTGTAPGIPADKNIGLDVLDHAASANNVLYDVCAPKGCHTCPLGAGQLMGTGMAQGGGTDWQHVFGPVVGGETIVLELMVFDVTDSSVDSHLLLDEFSWVAP